MSEVSRKWSLSLITVLIIPGMAAKKNRAIHVFTHIKSTYLDGLVCSNTSTEISILRLIVSTCTIYLSIEVEWGRVSVQNILEHDGITWTNHQCNLTCI